MPRVLFPGMSHWNGDMFIGVNVDPGTKGRQQAIKFNATHIRGGHTLRGGVDFRQHFRTQLQNGGFTSGSFNFANNFVRKDEDGFVPAAGLALGWASFMLGIPTAASVDTNDNFALMSPYYAWYGQDSWRVTRNLTITLGLRMEYEQGPTERYNRALTSFDPNLELPISAAAQAAYARNPLPELPASHPPRRQPLCRPKRSPTQPVAQRVDVVAPPLRRVAAQRKNGHPRWLRHLL